MKTFEILKDDINDEIKDACCRGYNSHISSYMVESETDEEVLQELYEYLKENGYGVELTSMTQNLRKLEISWGIT